MDGDVINISRRTNTITIIGAVNTPGTYQYINGFDAKDYIKMAEDIRQMQIDFLHLLGTLMAHLKISM